MPGSQSPPRDGGTMDRLLRVSVLVPAQTGRDLPPQAVRLLAGLFADPAFAVRVFAAPTPTPELVPLAVAAILAAERRVVSPPSRQALPALPCFILDSAAMAKDAVSDVVVDLGGGAVAAILAAAAAHGLWRIAATPIRAALAGATCTEVTLVRHTGDTAKSRIVASAIYDTKPLATHNAAYVAEKSAQMVLRELKRCARDDVPADLGPAEATDPGPSPGALGYVARTAGKTAWRVRDQIAKRRGRFLRPFGLRLGHGSVLDFDPATARPVQMPPVALWADPFLIAHEGAIHCFFEDVDPAVGHGHISVGRVTETGLADVRTALRRPYHMSYPFVFRHDGALMMMPEVHAAGRLEIWRCVNFPSEWELYATTLEDVPVADSVLFERDSEWWLFTHLSRDSFGDYCSDLHVFRVDGPQLTGLVPHRLNPVVTDASTARGGGRIHIVNGRLLRFSQDNSGGSYGYGLNMMEIVRLDLDHYEERRARHITPDFAPGLIGCHHFDAADGWFVIDVRQV